MPEPITMTRAQYQATYGTPPPVPATPVQPTQVDQTPIRMTRAQYQATYGQPVSTTPNPAVQIATDTVKNTATDYSQAVPNFMAEAGKNDASTSKNPIIRTAENTLAATASGLGTVFAPISGAIKATINQASDEKGIQSFAQNPIVSKMLDSIGVLQGHIDELAKAHPEFARNLQSAVTVGTAALGEKPATETANTAVDSTKASLGETVDTIAKTATDLTKEKPITPDEMKANLDGVANDWAKPTTINEPKYNNARAVLEKEPDAPKILAQNGINPYANLEDGKYDTEDVAQKLREDNGKLSKDLLRPSLEDADKTISPTPIEEFKPTIDNTYGVTADDAETIQAKLKAKIAALGRKYPEGMTLTNMLDEKITYDANGGYKAFKSNADNIDAIANRAIANTIRDTLTAKGEAAGIPVGDFQAELTKNYRAADYLDALHGKKAPVSTGQTIARYASRVIGAKAAGMIGGGDLVSEFVGYRIGGALEKFVEKMTNPMRDAFLKNLQKTNPPAFIQIMNRLNALKGEGEIVGEGFTMKPK